MMLIQKTTQCPVVLSLLAQKKSNTACDPGEKGPIMESDHSCLPVSHAFRQNSVHNCNSRVV